MLPADLVEKLTKEYDAQPYGEGCWKIPAGPEDFHYLWVQRSGRTLFAHVGKGAEGMSPNAVLRKVIRYRRKLWIQSHGNEQRQSA